MELQSDKALLLSDQVTRWCCIDRLSSQPSSDIWRVVRQISGNPTYHELSVADTKNICTTFAQLWQTPTLTGKIDPGDRR